jgi:shikimate dehydrogenase
MPHKAGGLALVDEATETAWRVGAINAARLRRRRPVAGATCSTDGERPRASPARPGSARPPRGAPRCRRRRPRDRVALAEAGVAAFSVHDLDPAKAVVLAADLQRAHPALAARAGAPRPGEFDLLVNATPTGMKPDDPLPWPVEGFAAGAVVGDVTTKPEVTPFLAAARERGGATVSGRDMVEGQLGALFRFFGFDADPLS